jgi:hypothetical protein
MNANADTDANANANAFADANADADGDGDASMRDACAHWFCADVPLSTFAGIAAARAGYFAASGDIHALSVHGSAGLLDIGALFSDGRDTRDANVVADVSLANLALDGALDASAASSGETWRDAFSHARRWTMNALDDAPAQKRSAVAAMFALIRATVLRSDAPADWYRVAAKAAAASTAISLPNVAPTTSYTPVDFVLPTGAALVAATASTALAPPPSHTSTGRRRRSLLAAANDGDDDIGANANISEAENDDSGVPVRPRRRRRRAASTTPRTPALSSVPPCSQDDIVEQLRACGFGDSVGGGGGGDADIGNSNDGIEFSIDDGAASATPASRVHTDFESARDVCTLAAALTQRRVKYGSERAHFWRDSGLVIAAAAHLCSSPASNLSPDEHVRLGALLPSAFAPSAASTVSAPLPAPTADERQRRLGALQWYALGLAYDGVLTLRRLPPRLSYATAAASIGVSLDALDATHLRALALARAPSSSFAIEWSEMRALVAAVRGIWKVE